MMNTRQLPLIALDVDGALSPISSASQKPAEAILEWGGEQNMTQATTPGSFGLWVANPVLEFLKKISRTRAEIQWCTSWMEMAQKCLGDDFKLPEWEVLPTEAEHRSLDNEWFKLKAVRRALEAGRQVIWIDDDLGNELDDNKDFFNFFLKNSDNLALIIPEVKIGITQRDLNFIDKKLSEWGF